ncbi:arginine N-methyltransferase PRMT10 [Olea europaea subsp. europaea]|uniref:Arginine N-methyltransferase PRMT10 n=1 Tax=Olea europaea subsp. europaea TaxID=158383 RepID=A0A8S0V6M0_OLEEU|nr:arginine N-methyltransferase PRMT10 [Olea europaea subsp. europaea]
MLSDCVRMDSYSNAVFENKHHFEGKAVLDVGKGSGILAIWSAQAGARKVYAVDATKMVEHASELVKAISVQDIFEVIEGSMEDVTFPEKVFDVIISEWMGYFLLCESMFDSVICACECWLKPSGVMYPSHARMWMAPGRSGLVDQKKSDYEDAMNDCRQILKFIESYYGVDIRVLTNPFAKEQRKYYLNVDIAVEQPSNPNQVKGTPVIIKEIDCSTGTINGIIVYFNSSISSSITAENTRHCRFAGWFDVHFRGSHENRAPQEIELTTAPNEDFGTHWGQQVFLLHPPVRAHQEDNLILNFSLTRSKENHRNGTSVVYEQVLLRMNLDPDIFPVPAKMGKFSSPCLCRLVPRGFNGATRTVWKKVPRFAMQSM